MVTPVSFIGMAVKITVTPENIPKHCSFYWNTCNCYPSIRNFSVVTMNYPSFFFSVYRQSLSRFYNFFPFINISTFYISMHCTNAYIWGNLRYIVKIQHENCINVVNTHGDGQTRLLWATWFGRRQRCHRSWASRINIRVRSGATLVPLV